MAKTHYKIKDKLVVQAQAEILFAEQYRDNKTREEWKKNDEAIRGFDQADEDTRAKVPLFQSLAFEETLLSKTDNSLIFKYSPGGLEDKRKSEMFEALRIRDAKLDRWDKKDRMGKRHAFRYGRAIFGYTASSMGGYKPNLFNIRPRHFYIDPDCGNDKEAALYLGWYGVKKGAWELRKGVEDGIYDKKAVEELIASGGNYTNTSEDNQDNKAGNAPTSTAAGQDKKKWRDDMFIFYQHFTTDSNGDRYILLLTKSGQCVRCEKWKDVESSNLFPIWTWAPSPDDAQFWSISPVGRVRRLHKAQEKSINQMLDNSEQLNKPKLAINVDFIRNISQVKYGTKGHIEVTGNQDINSLVKPLSSPPTTGPILVYDKLQTISDRQSGITPESAGVSDTNGVLGIVDKNLENFGDRINLLNKEYSEGYYEFALLYKAGVRTHLTEKIAVKMLGPNGIGSQMVSWADLKPTENDYDILIESSTAEAQTEKAMTKNKLEVLGSAKGDPMYNQRLVREKELEFTGFKEDEKRGLLDVKDGSEGMMVKAYEDFEKLVTNKEVMVPRNANAVYMQVLNDIWEDKDQMIDKQYGRRAPLLHKRIEQYLAQVQAVVEKNIALDAAMMEAKAVAPIAEDTNGGGQIDVNNIEDPNAIGTQKEPTPTN